jgi:DNA replication protein DnaC
MIASGIGLTLTGSSGTGKTMLSSLLLKNLVGAGHKGFFTTFHTLLDYFTAGWTSTDEKRWFDGRVRNAGVLVIDDMGREHKGRIDIAISTLDHVLRARVSSGRPTILTSNLTLPKLGELYSANALSLLSESSITIEFIGPDYRPTHQQTKIDEARQGLTRPIVIG